MSLDHDIQDVIAWLNTGARHVPVPSDMMAECCERLAAAGLPLWRVGVFIRTLHPKVFGRNFIWRPGRPVSETTVDFDIQQAPEFLNSPLALVFREGREVHVRPDHLAAARFPFFDEMRAEAVTDYIALPMTFLDGIIHASSWSTRQLGGFTEPQLVALKRVVPALARLIEAIGMRRVATMLLDTYVGRRAGERILAGQIRRGHTETMRAVIWLSDLRGFTALSDRLPPESVVDILNLYFDCQVPAILAYGGEVLKFMGDGLLAVFPVTGDAAAVCGGVLAAARDARAAVAQLRWRGPDPVEEHFRFGLALHVGEVLYGNIGGGDRLDFTCIGPAVNLAARLEKIAGRLGRTVVASAQFAGASMADWTDLGEFPVAGFASAARVFGLSDEVALASS